MKKKRKQFGFSDKHWEVVKRYLQEFDTAEKRTQALLQKIRFKGCSYCGRTDVRMNPGGRSAYCSSCHVNSHVTAGTFFHGMSRLDVMHPQFYFFDAGIEFSSNQIKTLFECAYNTAWESNKRIQKVIAEAMENTLDEIYSGLFESAYMKRSLETPAKLHPRSEQMPYENNGSNNNNNNNNDPEQQRNEQTRYANRTNEKASSAQVNPEQQIANHAHDTSQEMLLSVIGNEPISFDQIVMKKSDSISKVCLDLLQLELDGHIEKLLGDRYVRRQRMEPNTSMQISSIQIIEQSSCKLTAAVAQIVSFLKETFHGISRKYLQYFLGIYWFYHDKKFWRKGELLQQCVRHERITLRQIKDFVTPANVHCFVSELSSALTT